MQRCYFTRPAIAITWPMNITRQGKDFLQSLRTLAAWGHVIPADGGGSPFIVGPTGKIPQVAAIGRPTSGRRALLSSGQHSPPLGRSSAPSGAGQLFRSTERRRLFRHRGSRWLVGASARGCQTSRVAASGQCQQADLGRRLFERAQQAGLELAKLRAVTSDGAQGLLAYLRRNLLWVARQRRVWHLWRSLSRDLGRAASRALVGMTNGVAQSVREQVRDELVAMRTHWLSSQARPGSGTGRSLTWFDKSYRHKMEPILRLPTRHKKCIAPNGGRLAWDASLPFAVTTPS
jgi:hypothetical protein